MMTYTVVLDPDREEGGFTVRVPALPGCITEGETVDECIANARDVVRLYLDDLKASGESIPEEIVHPQLIELDIEEAV